MPYHLDMLCLANSWKHGGRCVAGKIYGGDSSGEWIRPVGPTVGQRQIAVSQMHYGRGEYADALDIVRIEVLGREPATFQRENLIASDARWIKLGRLGLDNLNHWLDNPATLWSNGESSRYGVNDKITSFRLEATRPSSLVMIRPDNGCITIKVAEERDEKIKIRVVFEHNRIRYALTTTDLRAQDAFRNRGIGEYPVQDIRAMTISLGERLPDGNTTKIVAQIFKG